MRGYFAIGPVLIGIAFISVMFLYSPSFNAPFYLDTPDMLSRIGIGDTFTPATFAHHAGWELSRLSGWPPEVSFRVMGIVLHWLTVLAVVWFVHELCRVWKLPMWSAWFAGGVFLIHPMATEPVIYVAQHYEMQWVLCGVVSAAAYLRFRLDIKEPWGPWGLGLFEYEWLSMLMLPVAITGLMVAAGTKSTALILIAWIGLVELVCFGLKWALMIGGGSVVVLAGYWSVVGTVWRLRADIYPLADYYWTQGRVLVTYMRLMVFPRPQYLLHDIRLTESTPTDQLYLNSMISVGSWAVVAVVLMIGIICAFRRTRMVRRPLTFMFPIPVQTRLIGLGILTFFTLLIPTVVIPQPNLLFEYRAYGALVGFVLAATGIALKIQSRIPKRAWVVLILLLSLGLSARTYIRATEWSDPVEFWESNIRHQPLNTHAHIQLASRYMLSGLDDKWDEGLATLIHARANETELNRYYEVPGKRAIALNLYSVWMQRREYVQAAKELSIASGLGIDNVSVRIARGDFFMRIGDVGRATREFERLTEIRGDLPYGWAGLDMLGVEGAEEKLEEIMRGR